MILKSLKAGPMARRLMPSITALVFACIALMLFAAQSQAFGIVNFDGEATNPDGTPSTQAGAHSDVTVDIELSRTTDGSGTPISDGSVKNMHVDLPTGLVGNPNAAPKCTPQQLGFGVVGACPDSTQVGVAFVHLAGSDFPTAVYNMEPPPGVPAQFGFNIFQIVSHINARVRSRADGYGLAVDVDGISQSLPIIGAKLTLWGVPADPVHDSLRGAIALGSCNDDPDPLTSSAPCPANTPKRPFMTLPMDCSAGPVTTSLRTDAWQQPGIFKTAQFVSHLPDRRAVGVDGCDKLRFEPTIEVQPDKARSGQPSGLLVRVSIPQDENPDGLATPPLKKAVVTLPEGVAVSPSGAHGLRACSPNEIGIDDLTEPSCPDASKLGQLDIVTPLLAEPMRGSIYLAKQTENPFGTTLAIYLVARGPGVLLKLPGKVEPDQRTGQVKTTFDNNPQLPFSELTLRFDGGPTAALSMPTQCGPATATAELTPWSSDVPVTTTSTFNVSGIRDDVPCVPRGFAPGFEAGTTNPVGGKDSSFTLTFSREDSDQELRDVVVDMPRGLLARIADVPLCADAAANAGACDASSLIGRLTTAAGPGTEPYYLPGQAYLTGPYKGAPYGLSMVVPAVAGPFNLGNVIVRAAIFVDRQTTALRVVSDPLPTILQGIPLQVRRVNVHIDRPGFMFNPTNCNEMRVGGRITSTSGAASDVSNRFQVADCGALPFTPRMSLVLGKRGRTRNGITTPLSVTLAMSRGQANSKSIKVTLPKMINARLEVVRRACTLEEFHAGRCSAGARIGSAVAVTPLLRDPLRGPAFFVKNPARTLPDIMVALHGQVDIDLTGKVRIPRTLQLSTTFDTVPDAPISKFRLDLIAGRNGTIGLTENICTARARRQAAELTLISHSGKVVQRNQRLKVAGCGRATTRATRRPTRRPASRSRSSNRR